MAVGGLLVIGACSAAMSDGEGDKPLKPAAASDSPFGETPETLPEDQPEAPSEAPEKTVPTKDNLTIKLKITSRQCFGSAGCNVEYEPRVTINGDSHLAGDYDVTYKVLGDESGPIIETITLYANGKYDLPWFSSASTPSQNTRLVAKVVSIEKK